MAPKEARVQSLRLVRPEPDLDLQTGRAQRGDSTSSCLVRVATRDDDAADAGPLDRFRARRSVSDVIAGLQRHVESGSRGRTPRPTQGHDFGVIAAVLCVPAPPHDLRPARDDGADHGIRCDLTPATTRELDRLSHETGVVRVALRRASHGVGGQRRHFKPTQG